MSEENQDKPSVEEQLNNLNDLEPEANGPLLYEGKKTRKPYKPLKESQVKPLCERQWTNSAIAGYLDVSRTSLERQFGAKLHLWKQLGCAYLLDHAWQRIQDKNYKNEKLFIEMMKRYVWKTHLDKVRIERVLGPGEKERDEKLSELYAEIQAAAQSQKNWLFTEVEIPKQIEPTGLLSHTEDAPKEDTKPTE